MFPLSNNRKLGTHKLRLKLHIIFEEQVSGALQEVWSMIHCHNILILKLEEGPSYVSTPQFEGLDVVRTP
jgi:hypothetical protein